jgi:hypothetical protein
VVVFCRSTSPGPSVVVVVVELSVAGASTTAGAGVTSTTGAGAGTVSTTGAGVVVSSTVRWYEKQPATIPQVAIAAGIIAKRLIDRILVASIRYITGEQQEAGHLKIHTICLILLAEEAALLGKSFRVMDLTVFGISDDSQNPHRSPRCGGPPLPYNGRGKSRDRSPFTLLTGTKSRILSLFSLGAGLSPCRRKSETHRGFHIQ